MEFLAGVPAQEKAAPEALFLTEESSRGGRLRRCVKSPPESSSSVGVTGESSESEEEEEEEDGTVSSQGRWLDSSSSSLEDSLPIKRGLSNHYIGKSKSFGNLMGMEVNNTKDLEKVESPLNKRRRLLIANKLRRRSLSSSFSFYPKTNLNSMPLLALQESDEDDHKYNNDDDDDDSSDEEINKLQDKRMKMTNNRDFMVQTQSCFCLSSFPDDDR
ncbi:hypothetical protein IGI04_013604 [Brassica rapa subsp. trilocularis]|uniref:Uncharacterized protein n=1 Tax=Brassica rapa subsp. trilocularis TaxID=1813537 RepID=A0ABQ7NBQ0_BRACM|nr:hypothetical protein IGI04_013604 [Brassica rapa subsp. trilocularis]